MGISFLSRYKHIILYGISLALLLFVLKWLEVRFIVIDHAFELYIGAIAFIFTALGIWIALRFAKPGKTIVVEKTVEVPATGPFTLNENAMAQCGISQRELEVLQLMADGLSNQEIATRLFVSLNTIKTHASRIFFKLDVKRRTQAIEKAKKLSLIP